MKALSVAPHAGLRTIDLAPVVDGLVAANEDIVAGRRGAVRRQVVPARDVLERVLADLRAILFPAHFGALDLSAEGLRRYVGQRLDVALRLLQEQVRRAFVFVGANGDGDATGSERRAIEITREFARRLPTVRVLLGTDVRAVYEGDPAATGVDEVAFSYPGIAAVMHYRIAHELHELGVPLIARMMAEIAHGATGVDIHPGARIGQSFFLDHGTGTVIGETCIIGERVRLYQGVTLGAKSVPTDEHGRPIKGRPRHPIVEDDVTIYPGATILGRITIGRGSTIGGNAWLTRAVPPGSYITQAQIRDDLFDGGSGI